MKDHGYLRFCALLLCASALAGCSGGETGGAPAAGQTSAGTTVAETTTVLTDGLPDTNMNGYEYTILNHTESSLSWANTRITVDTMDGDVLNDALYARTSKLEDRFSFKLNVKEDDAPHNVIPKAVLAGDSAYDSYQFTETAPLTSQLPYIMDWNSLSVLTPDSPWWNPAATSVYNISGKQTALAGNVSLAPASRAVCMVFNKKIWTDRGDGADLYALASDGKWTVDTYLKLAKSVGADLDGDGKYTVKDLYGLNMGRGFKGYVASFLGGTGISFTAADKDGRQSFTLNKDERGITLLRKLVDALGEKGYYYNEDASVHSFAPADFFSSGHALFTQGVPNDIYKLRNMEDDIGIIPMPKLDEAQDSYHSAAWGGAILLLPSTFDMKDAEYAGIILEAMSFAGYYDVVPQYKEIALKTKTARDDESADMLDIIFAAVSFDFGTNIMYDAVFAGSFLTDIWKAKSSDIIVSSMEKALPTIEKYIADLTKLTEAMA